MTLTLTRGTRLGPYEIVSAIGAGGMGEVYRARDTKLGRDVALKILPAALATDADRLARFQREARTLASLNHPNIGGIHGLEETDGVTALVMELVEGEDLAQRITRGAIPLDETLSIAQQIAQALEAAHEQGIIHRDLKPANIKLRPDGTVKVLDFGLAKAIDPNHGSATAGRESQSPTITSPAVMTGVGVILGTAAYMAPEQAKGHPADKRSDLWALGCVFYEMLTGKRAFDGDNISETLANVLKSEPDWRALPQVSASLRRLLQRCLTKDRKRRLDSAAAARLEIDDALTLPASDQYPSAAIRGSIDWRRAAVIAIAALVLGSAATGTALWLAMRPALPQVVRTAILTSGATALVASNASSGPLLALTPDGFRVVYRGAGQIVVRALDQLEPTTLTGLGVPWGQFISPDGQSVGYFDSITSIKRVPISGGPSVTLARLDGLPRGATWGAEGTIVFATNTLTTGLQRVSSDGGDVSVLTKPDRERGEADHLWPEYLPDEQAVLFTVTPVNGGLAAARIAVLDLRTGTQKVLLDGGSHARFLPTGHIVYGDAGTLRAVAFDVSRLAVVGTSVPVLTDVAINASGGVEVAVARHGTLAYLPSGTLDAGQRRLVWVDRQGREEPLAAPPRAYLQPRISPDGRRVAVFSADQEQDLWVWDLARKTLTRLTTDPSIDSVPLWTSDSKRIFFGSVRAGAPNLYVQPADGSGSATRLTDSPSPQFPTGITPDGASVAFVETTPNQARDLRMLTLTPTPQVTPLVETRFDERGVIVSPDGRWIAYESNSSGRYEIYVRPFPEVGNGLWQVSTAGGVQPLWARSGRELFYVSPDGGLMSVSVDVQGTNWSASEPARILESGYFTGGGNVTRHYDVTADGQRFLMIKEDPTNTNASSQIVIVQNWFEELKRLVPTK